MPKSEIQIEGREERYHPILPCCELCNFSPLRRHKAEVGRGGGGVEEKAGGVKKEKRERVPEAPGFWRLELRSPPQTPGPDTHLP